MGDSQVYMYYLIYLIYVLSNLSNLSNSAFVPEENDMAKSFEGTVIEVLSGN